MINETKHNGLRQQILEAPTVQAIVLLLEQGADYDWASVQTRNAWARAADRRRRELSRPPKPIPVPAPAPAEVKA